MNKQMFNRTRGEHVHHYTTDYVRTDAKTAHSPHDIYNVSDNKSEQKKDIIKHNHHDRRLESNGIISVLI